MLSIMKVMPTSELSVDIQIVCTTTDETFKTTYKFNK
uniref:Uncharacterized protein n=1 Tax=Anguilla anguilla TaxID=7936 RepID=A0A0E9RWW6_ANGAN